MSRRSVAVVLGGMVALAAAGAAFVLLREDGEDRALSTISTTGRPIAMAVPENLGPFAGDLTGDVELLAARDGIRFVRMARTEGGWCYGTADDRGLTNFACETETNPFPSGDVPVLNVSRQQGTEQPGIVEYLSFAGFAADAVRRVGIVDAEGRVVPVAVVVDNTFHVEAPVVRGKQIVALDETGDVIWRGPEVPLPDE